VDGFTIEWVTAKVTGKSLRKVSIEGGVQLAVSSIFFFFFDEKLLKLAVKSKFLDQWSLYLFPSFLKAKINTFVMLKLFNFRYLPPFPLIN